MLKSILYLALIGVLVLLPAHGVAQDETSEPAPLALGSGIVEPERVEALRAELLQRKKRDQEVRQIFSGGAQPSEEQLAELQRVDEDNTAYLLKLLAEVGWIDSQRFGPEASSAAWLLVQHSNHLSLMVTVLPEIRRDFEETGHGGSEFALLFDRTQLRLGKKQRYGSQIHGGPDGLFVAPLEDPETVDERRREVGLGPLEEYMEYFQAQNGGKPLEIRRSF